MRQRCLVPLTCLLGFGIINMAIFKNITELYAAEGHNAGFLRRDKWKYF